MVTHQLTIVTRKLIIDYYLYQINNGQIVACSRRIGTPEINQLYSLSLILLVITYYILLTYYSTIHKIMSYQNVYFLLVYFPK